MFRALTALTVLGVALAAPVLPAGAAPPAPTVTAVSCVYGDACFAGLSDGVIDVYARGVWTRETDLGDGAVTSLSCTATVRRATCAGALQLDGDTYRALWYDGNHWHQRPAAPGYAVDVSCGSGFCMVMTDLGRYQVRSRATHFVWSAPAASTSNRASALSCTRLGPRECRAVDPRGNVQRWYSGRWHAGRHLDDTALVALGCGYRTCEAIDISGRATRFDGSSWSTVSAVSGLHGQTIETSLQCTSDAFCLVVDSLGNRAHWTSGAWHDGGAQRAGYVSLGCHSHRFCVAGRKNGDAVARVDGSWHSIGRS